MTSHAGIQVFMKKLNQLIHCNDIPFIYNNPEIISQRPQFQLLYHELQSVIQTLGFFHQHQDNLEKVNDLKKKFIDAAEEAQYIVDCFLSDVHISNNGNLLTYGETHISKRSLKSVLDLFLSCVHIRKNTNLPTSDPSLNLDDVRSSLMSLKGELNIEIDLSPRPDTERIPIQSAPAPISTFRNSQGLKKSLDEVVVGLDDDVKLIRDKLVEDRKKVDVVSIVGMGGIGKTTLATKVFNDRFIMHHFYIRVWVTVSQTYDKRAVLVQILESIRGQLGLEKANDSRLREMVHKSLMGRRYLIVIDDIWDIEAWDNLKLFFPHDNNGSRILLTSRVTEVAKHANSDGLIHHLWSLNKKRSWEMLCQKVFCGSEYPEWSIKPGKKIVESCHGLPLAVAVIAGVLAKEAWSEKFWVEIAERTGSYIVGEENGYLEALALSYNHLPLHLRECFLYLGCFPEDYKIQVKRLIRLWVAEGFIEEDGNISLEDIAEGYLMDLIDRNLLIVAHRSKYNGGIKACKMHDLVRELCLKKAKEEKFILQTEWLILSSNVITPLYKPVRMVVNTYDPDLSHLFTQNLRSILLFRDVGPLSDTIAKYFRSFALLRVLDLQTCIVQELPKGMELLVHLRYLAIWNSSPGFPDSICKLWNLQTLIYDTSVSLTETERIVLPSNISDLVNLRCLWSFTKSFIIPNLIKPLNLQTISAVELEDGFDNFQKCFPCIKELTCRTYKDEENNFKSLIYLEKLKLNEFRRNWRSKNLITFPTTLKTLTLESCHLLWSDMSTIQSLPNLQVLKLKHVTFEGSCWNTDGQEFRQLKFLRIEGLDIKKWEVYSTSFPCLKQLEITSCRHLKEIPLEIGDIPTLELIKIKHCSHSVNESARRIQEEQQELGNYDLKIHILEPSSWL